MFGILKRIKTLEEKINHLEDADFLNYYRDQYTKEYITMFESAKKEISNYQPLSIEPGFNGYSTIVQWKNTRRYCSAHNDYIDWFYNDQKFRKEDCEILESLYNNIPAENLKTYNKRRKK